MRVLVIVCILCSSILSSAYSYRTSHLFPPKLRSHERTVHCRLGCVAGDGPASEDVLSFGNRLDVMVELPTSDRNLVDRFLEDTGYIAENTWEKTKIRKVADNTYVLQFLAIPIPGIAIVMPEVEVVLDNIRGVVHMQSTSWSLKAADGGELKDSSLSSSFDVQLSGQLRVCPDREGDAEADYDDLSYLTRRRPLGGRKVVAEGHVVYSVKGRKPGVFRRAPAALLDGTVAFVQRCLSDFVNKRFGKKLIKAFKEYSRQALVREDWG